MIDTDKYEGHTPKHWRRKYNFGQMPFNKADENLIYDAPLLLAEVKRLREGIEHALHIRLRHGQEEGWKELKKVIE